MGCLVQLVVLRGDDHLIRVVSDRLVVLVEFGLRWVCGATDAAWCVVGAFDPLVRLWSAGCAGGPVARSQALV